MLWQILWWLQLTFSRIKAVAKLQEPNWPMAKKFEWWILLSIHIHQLLKRLNHQYPFPEILSRETGLKITVFGLHANDCNCVLQGWFFFSWEVSYFTFFRVQLHDGRVTDLVVNVIILTCPTTIIALTYIYITAAEASGYCCSTDNKY